MRRSAAQVDRAERADRAIVNLLLDPLRLERLAAASERAHTDVAQSVVSAIVARAALTLRSDHSSFTLLGVHESTAFFYEADPLTVPTEITYCRFAAIGEPFRVADAKRHPLVCHLPATTEQDIGSYLGVPVTFAGFVLGALCVWDNKPRKWTAQEESWLIALADELTEWWKT